LPQRSSMPRPAPHMGVRPARKRCVVHAFTVVVCSLVFFVISSPMGAVRPVGPRPSVLAERPWWKMPPWRWRDPCGIPRWKRFMGLPVWGVRAYEGGRPFWAMYYKVASLPINAVFYTMRTVTDAPKAVYKRMVQLRPGAIVRVVDCDLEKDMDCIGDVEGCMVSKNVLLGRYKVKLITGREKIYNCNDLEYSGQDQLDDPDRDAMEFVKNASVYYDYPKDSAYYDEDATISDDDDVTFRHRLETPATLTFGGRQYFLPGDRVRIINGYRQGEYATIVKWIPMMKKWGVETMFGEELLAYNASQLDFFDPTLPLESLISRSDPHPNVSLALIREFRRNKTGFMRELEREMQELADDPNLASSLALDAIEGHRTWANVERALHNPVLQHFVNLHYLLRPKVSETVTAMRSNPILTAEVEAIVDKALEAGGPKLQMSRVLQRPVNSFDFDPNEKDIRPQLLKMWSEELLPQLGVYDWKESDYMRMVKRHRVGARTWHEFVNDALAKQDIDINATTPEKFEKDISPLFADIHEQATEAAEKAMEEYSKRRQDVRAPDPPEAPEKPPVDYSETDRALAEKILNTPLQDLPEGEAAGDEDGPAEEYIGDPGPGARPPPDEIESEQLPKRHTQKINDVPISDLPEGRKEASFSSLGGDKEADKAIVEEQKQEKTIDEEFDELKQMEIGGDTSDPEEGFRNKAEWD